MWLRTLRTRWITKLKHYLEYLSCQVNSSSVNAAYSPLGNFSASFKKLVSILTIWRSRSNKRCFKFSISTCKCKLLWSQLQFCKNQNNNWSDSEYIPMYWNSRNKPASIDNYAAKSLYKEWTNTESTIFLLFLLDNFFITRHTDNTTGKKKRDVNNI